MDASNAVHVAIFLGGVVGGFLVAWGALLADVKRMKSDLKRLCRVVELLKLSLVQAGLLRASDLPPGG